MTGITYIGTCLEVTAADGTAVAETTADSSMVDAAKANSHSKVEVTGVISIGELGDTAEDVSYNLLKGGRTKHVNGVRDIGDVDVTCEYNAGDAGQNRIRALSNSNTTVTFLIKDADDQYTAFNGVVANYRETPREASSYKGCMFTMRGQSRLDYGD